MFNNRMLAVAAVLVMAVPALGAATPIVVPPVPEQLVEGHTVFTVVEIVAVTATNEVRFAAAVAVLVREYRADNSAQRFPGVLWFNDQYLVNPDQSAAASRSFRYPCGGAVMAVNQGDPDPRVVIARATINPSTVAGTPVPGASVTVGDDTHTYTSPPWTKPYPGTYTYGGHTADPGDDDYAWVGADVGPTTVDPAAASPATTSASVSSDTVLGAVGGSVFSGFDYRESYLITDPNDHSWFIDVYDFYTRDQVSTATGYTTGQVYTFPVWTVNLLGSPVFVPDFGTTVTGLRLGENCMPFKDLISTTLDPGLSALPCAADVNPSNNPLPPYTDDPCMGYEEPSRWAPGYCYGGQDSTPSGGACPHGTPGNQYPHVKDGQVNEPLRQYNALLYFKLEDLRIDGGARDHSLGSTDTNGCAEEQYAWGPNPPQAANDWPCPGNDDDAEGNSHPFHPSAPPHVEAEECRPEFYGPNPTNHGGSTYITPGMPTNGGYYQTYAPCDYLHTTRNIDVYFSPAGRPFEPALRNFDIIDLEGSAAPFQDYHSAYGGP